MQADGSIGSIPACAGEPRLDSGGASFDSVYPRVCGGTNLGLSLTEGAAGLSPRVRGNPLRVDPQGGQKRSIPACAGEPNHRAVERLPSPVYPRVCGGTPSSPAAHPQG